VRFSKIKICGFLVFYLEILGGFSYFLKRPYCRRIFKEIQSEIPQIKTKKKKFSWKIIPEKISQKNIFEKILQFFLFHSSSRKNSDQTNLSNLSI